MMNNFLKLKLYQSKYKLRQLIAQDYYSKGVINLPYPPNELFIEPTNYCNLRCITCPQHSGLKREKGYMDIALFKKIIQEAKNKALKLTLHFAGESLMAKNIFTMIKMASEAHFYTRFHTNATLLTAEKSKRLLESGLDEISFSFDGLDKGMYEKIRINANFEQTHRNICHFLKLKKMANQKSPYTILQLIKVIESSTNNSDEEERFKNLFKGLPVDKFHFIRPHSYGGYYEDHSCIEHSSFGKSYFPCFRIWDGMAVGWDGKVYACCNDLNGEYLLGDVNNENLMDIWNSKRMCKLRSSLVNHKYKQITPCNKCDVLFSGNGYRIKSQFKGMKGYIKKIVLNQIKGIRFLGKQV